MRESLEWASYRLLADVPGFKVTGLQRRSDRSAWKIDALNRGESPIGGDEPGLAELIQRTVEKGSFKVTDDISTYNEADAILRAIHLQLLHVTPRIGAAQMHTRPVHEGSTS